MPPPAKAIKALRDPFQRILAESHFFLSRLQITRQERQVFLFLSMVIFAGLVLDLSVKGRLDRFSACRVLDDPSFYPRLNINTAKAAELVAIPYLGPVTAKVIMDHRPFKDLQELKSLPGIREGNFRRMEKYLKVK